MPKMMESEAEAATAVQLSLPLQTQSLEKLIMGCTESTDHYDLATDFSMPSSYPREIMLACGCSSSESNCTAMKVTTFLVFSPTVSLSSTWGQWWVSAVVTERAGLWRGAAAGSRPPLWISLQCLSLHCFSAGKLSESRSKHQRSLDA